MKVEGKITMTVHLHSDRDAMWELGEQLGFKGDDLIRFKHTLGEVAVKIEVDMATAKYKILSVDGLKVEEKT